VRRLPLEPRARSANPRPFFGAASTGAASTASTGRFRPEAFLLAHQPHRSPFAWHAFARAKFFLTATGQRDSSDGLSVPQCCRSCWRPLRLGLLTNLRLGSGGLHPLQPIVMFLNRVGRGQQVLKGLLRSMSIWAGLRHNSGGETHRTRPIVTQVPAIVEGKEIGAFLDEFPHKTPISGPIHEHALRHTYYRSRSQPNYKVLKTYSFYGEYLGEQLHTSLLGPTPRLN